MNYEPTDSFVKTFNSGVILVVLENVNVSINKAAAEIASVGVCKKDVVQIVVVIDVLT